MSAPTPTQTFRRSQSDFIDKAPAIRAQFFYASPIPIDDPLSPVPPPSSVPSTAPNLPPRPFSDHDNQTLEKSWLELKKQISNCRAENLRKRTTEERNSGFEERGAPHTLRSSRHARFTQESPSSRQTEGSPASYKQRRRPIGDNARDFASSSNGFTPTKPQSNDLPDSPLTEDATRNEVEHEMDTSLEGLTGTPFIRAPLRSRPRASSRREPLSSARLSFEETQNVDDPIVASEKDNNSDGGQALYQDPDTKVPVGISRLHQVAMPHLQMEPIYWSPVNDIANVVRATWFYKDSMLPVEVDVSNLLEANYLNVRPWTQTWQDELNSATRVGAEGEEKVTFPLWPEKPTSRENRPGTMASLTGSVQLEEDSAEKRRQDAVDLACEKIDMHTQDLMEDFKAAGGADYGKDGRKRHYSQASVIFANRNEAFILRQNLQPSSYYGRRPLANYIRKGHKIGVRVTRGFDRKAWDELHPVKGTKKAAHAFDGVSASQITQSGLLEDIPDPALALSSKPTVTDLVLVIHGIGQKLSERVESFHFTHSMNSFRRSVNVELGTPAVKIHLRKDMGGLMVLPVNWRSTLSFEDGGYKSESPEALTNQFTLKDITPDSLPSVRNVISDVMLDIPYYLSQHQPKMIAAVVNEANRVYQLWCKNNPGFEKYGQVHLIAHSLGSVMAIDILSNQETKVSSIVNARPDIASGRTFVFDVKNLYLCGSPAALFLLIKNQSLVPRKNRNKPSAGGEDVLQGVAGEKGTYGCIAADNIYNIVNPYDPVAYRLNATVDAAYAASLKPAFIPSASNSWLSFGNPFKSENPASKHQGAPVKPSLTTRLPSSVELETHNFSKEELAERRAYLLNDNGQIDFYLKYGGGPLEIQYLTMLGAHSSYWQSKDFIRFVVIETGREQGRNFTLPSTTAVKKKAFANSKLVT